VNLEVINSFKCNRISIGDAKDKSIEYILNQSPAGSVFIVVKQSNGYFLSSVVEKPDIIPEVKEKVNLSKKHLTTSLLPPFINKKSKKND